MEAYLVKPHTPETKQLLDDKAKEVFDTTGLEAKVSERDKARKKLARVETKTAEWLQKEEARVREEYENYHERRESAQDAVSAAQDHVADLERQLGSLKAQYEDAVFEQNNPEAKRLLDEAGAIRNGTLPAAKDAVVKAEKQLEDADFDEDFVIYATNEYIILLREAAGETGISGKEFIPGASEARRRLFSNEYDNTSMGKAVERWHAENTELIKRQAEDPGFIPSLHRIESEIREMAKS